ncbi:MAG: AMP-binding protein [Pseudomonadota bacterium]
MRSRHPAIVSGDVTLSYAAFAERVRNCAGALLAHGVRQGALVGLALKDSVDHLVLLFSLARIGAVIVPMDWRWSQAEKARLVRHMSLGFVIVEAEAAAIGDARMLRPDGSWAAAPAAPMVLEPDRPVILSLSSGTTGRPTGPLATHAQMLARIANQLVTLTFSQHDRYLLATPLYFGGGRAFALTHLHIGATLILCPPPYQPEALVAEIADKTADTSFLVPTQIRRLLALDDAALARARGLRLLISSGAPLRPEERREIARRITPGFIEYYASTEGGGITVLTPQGQKQHPDSVGCAAFMVTVEIVDDAHRTLPPDQIGQVRYRGPGVAQQIYREPDKTAAPFRGGWFYPGDLGRMNAAGYLTLLGRAKDVILRGGVNIYPLEIEQVLAEHPAVAEAAVLPQPHAELGETILAAVVAHTPLSAEVLAAHCRSRLAPYKQPARIVFLNALPRNSAGKVVKAMIDISDA